MWLKLSSCGQENAPVEGEVSWRLMVHHTKMALLVPVCATRGFFTPSFAAAIPGRAREEGGREEAKPAQPLPLPPVPGQRQRRGAQPFPGPGLRNPAVQERHPAPQPPNPSRDTDFGRPFPRQRSLASRSPCCLSQGITHDSNLTHRTISVSRCFSRQR